MTDSAGTARESAEASRVPEGFVPATMRGELADAERTARYEWAAQLCSGRRTLDVGCGAGYGAELLHRAGAEVVGIDNAATALDLARASVSAGPAFELGDARDLPFDDNSFDLVVCFEVIDQVDEQTRVLDELARVLAPDGLLMISSANRDRDVPGNPHHGHELLRDELMGLLDARFPAVRLLSQHVMLATVIGWTEGPRSIHGSVQRTAAPEAADELSLLAMAGSELPPDPGSLIVLTRFAAPRVWLRHIDTQERHINDLTRYQGELESREVDGWEALERLAEAEGNVAELTASRALLEAELQGKVLAHGREVERMAGEIATIKRQLSTLAGSRSWRLTRPIRRVGAMLRRR